MATKALIIDIDGTLIDKRTHRLPKTAVASIKHLKKSDIKVILATGRTQYSIDKSIINAVKPDYIVSINGAVCYDSNNEVVFEEKISKDLVEDFIMWADQEQLEYAFHMSHKTVVYKGQQIHKKIVKFLGHSYSLINTLNNQEHNDYAVYNMIVHKVSRDLVKGFIKARPTLQYDEFDSESFDVFNKTTNKAVGCDVVLKLLNITWNEVMALGDSTNDIEVLKKAKTGYVVRGGHPDIFKLGLPITDEPLKDGLAKALGYEGLIPLEKNLLLLDSDDVIKRMKGSRLKMSSLISAAFAVAALNEFLIKGVSQNLVFYLVLSLIMAIMAVVAYRKQKSA